MEIITILTLSRHAGRILPHLEWLPKEVLSVTNRYPYHSARCFAEGMARIIKREQPKHYYQHNSLFDDFYGLCTTKFKAIIPQRVLILLNSLGELAEVYILNGVKLEQAFNLRNPSIYNIVLEFNNSNDVKLKAESLTSQEQSMDSHKCAEAIELAKDTGASNLDGMKECWLVLKEWEKLYENESENYSDIEKIVYSLDTEETPYPIDYYLQEGDERVLDKSNGVFEKGWPDVIKRNNRYTIVGWRERTWDAVYFTSKSASDLEDIRMPVYLLRMSGHFVVAKKNGRWGAIYNGGHYFLKIIVPFVYLDVSEVQEKVQSLFGIKGKFASWDDFHGPLPKIV